MRKRSRSPLEETDESRATEPARGESDSEAPGHAEAEKDSGPQRSTGQKRRARRRGAAKDSAQGTLFDEASAQSRGEPQPSGERASEGRASEGRAPEGQAPEGGDAKKSRSKRRRERRKAAKALDPAGPEAAPKPKAAYPSHREGPRPEAHGAPARGPSRKPREASPPARDERRPRGPSQHPRAQASGQRSSEAFRERRNSEAGRRRSHPEGLPPLSPEDLAAVARSGYEEDGSIPRYVSNVRGHSRSVPAEPPRPARRLETLSPSSGSMSALAALESVLDEAAPLQAKHRAALNADIRRLWEELTSDRESRSAEYLGTPPALSAYLRYFLPWNVFRLASILSNADFCLPDNAVVADIGSGPLTLPIALWAARPELREVPLTIYCMDRVERVLEAGRTVFETLCLRVGGRLPPWRIETRKDSFGAPLPERAHLLTAANVFNEFFWKDKRSLGERALETARTLLSYTRENGSVFVMEPGDPRSGAFISALRAALLAEGAPPLGPCPHSLSCPMPGIFRHLLPPEETRTAKNDPNVAPSRYILPQVIMPKKRDKFPWCHFGIDAIEAPAWLEALSEEAGLPKERAVLSYVWAARGALARPPVGMPEPAGRGGDRERRAKAGRGILVRVVSEPFALADGSSGQYACSSLGYTLLRRARGEEPFGSGDLLEVTTAGAQRTDEKSGAIVLPT